MNYKQYMIYIRHTNSAAMIHPRWVLAMSVDDAMDKYEINNGTTAKLDRRATKAHYLGELLCK